MLSLLKPLVSKLVIFILFITSLSAKDIPITQEMELMIPVGQFSVVEFPFKITSKNITSFMGAIEKSDGNIVREDKILEEPIVKKDIKENTGKEKNPKKSKEEDISIVQNVNSFTFFPKKAGAMKLVIWGYDHPILLSIKAVAKDGFSSYRLITPLSKSSDVMQIEQNTHEQVINTLMVHLFNQTQPKGYKNSTRDENYKSNGFELKLNREMLGKSYLAQEWLLTNTNEKEAIIHEESFYQKGIYAVAVESDKVGHKENVRVFIIRQTSKERGE